MENNNPLKITPSGFETELEKRPTFWQAFALIALIAFCLTAIMITAIICSHALFLLAGGLPWVGKLLGIKKIFGPRSP